MFYEVSDDLINKAVENAPEWLKDDLESIAKERKNHAQN